MKKVLVVILTLLLLSPGAAFAGPAKAEAGLTPDSRFYWFDRLGEKLQLLFTLDGQAKAQVLSKMGLERLAEAQSVENTETVGRLISDYVRSQDRAAALVGDNIEGLAGVSEAQVEAVERLGALTEGASGIVQKKIDRAVIKAAKLLDKQTAKLEKIGARTSSKGADQANKTIEKTTARLNRLAGKLSRVGKNETDTPETTGTPKNGGFATVADRVRAMRAKHLSVLERVIENAPEAAKPGLWKAYERSSMEADESTTTYGQGKRKIRGRGRR